MNEYKSNIELNLGTGKGISVLDLISTFEKVSNKSIPIKFVERRKGDVSSLFTDPTKSEEIIDFRTTKTLEEMCEDTWRWLMNNPEGYRSI